MEGKSCNASITLTLSTPQNKIVEMFPCRLYEKSVYTVYLLRVVRVYTVRLLLKRKETVNTSAYQQNI